MEQSSVLIKEVVKELRKRADEIESGNCVLTQDEAMHIFSAIAHEGISREAACNYMNMNPNKFNDYVAMKKVPKGRKRFGFKELVWYIDELFFAKMKMREKNK